VHVQATSQKRPEDILSLYLKLILNTKQKTLERENFIPRVAMLLNSNSSFQQCKACSEKGKYDHSKVKKIN
jgi:hypothetical protein